MEQATGMLSERASAVIKPIQAAFEGVDYKYTTCWSNGCFGPACVLKCNVRDNKIVAVEPDDTIHVNCARDHEEFPEDFGKGLFQHRACAQGHAWKWELDSPTRLTKPLKRVGWDERGQGVYEEISWEEAAEFAAEQIVEAYEKYGPHIVFHSNEPVSETCQFVFDRWTDLGIGCWGNISYSGPDSATKFWFGWDWDDLSHGRPLCRIANDASDVLNSDLILMWGWNALERDYHTYPNYIKMAREKGTPVICVDPVYHWSSEVLADQWIPIRPQSDVTMLLAMAYVLFEQDLIDHEFMEQWVDMEGVPKFKAYVMGDEDGVPKTPEWAEPICGVPAETIRALAVMYGEAEAVHFQYSVGASRQHRGEYPAAMSAILQAMTGNTFKPGGYNGPMDVNYGTIFGGTPIPYFHRGLALRDGGPHTRLHGVKWADAIMYRDKLDSGEWTVDEYNHFVGNDPGNEPPNIQVVVLGSHHINNYADVNQRIKAVKKVHFSMGYHFSTEQLAPKFLDLVIPSAHKLESTDCNTYEDAPNWPFNTVNGAMWNHFVFGQRVVEQPESIYPKDYFHVLMAKEFEKRGFEDLAEKFAGYMLDAPLEEWHENVNKYNGAAWDDFAANNEKAKELYGGPMPSWQEFLDNGCVFRVPVEKPFTCCEDGLVRENFQLGTTSGKIEFVPQYLEAVDLNETRYAGHLDAVPRWNVSFDDDGPKGSLFNSEVERYPLTLLTPVTQYRQHSYHWNNPALNGECYEHRIWMNTVDAARRGIKDGDEVRVYNDLAEAHLTAYVTDRIAPRVTNIYHGAWYNTAGEITEKMPFGIDTAGACNLFTGMDFGKDNKNAFLKNALLEIEKL